MPGTYCKFQSSWETALTDSPLPWDSIDPLAARWTDDAYDMLKTGTLKASIIIKSGVETAIVKGECPRCGHDFEHSQIQTAVANFAEDRQPDREPVESKSKWVFVDARCNCISAHSGRPSSQTQGCGIAFCVPALATDE